MRMIYQSKSSHMGGNAPSFGAMTARREGLPARSDSRPHGLLCDQGRDLEYVDDAMDGIGVWWYSR